MFSPLLRSPRSVQRNQLKRQLKLESLESRQLLAGDIAGAVYHDLNENGSRDQGEDGLSNWIVFLDSNENGALDSGEQSLATNADGDFIFRSLPAGSYRVAEVLRPDWTATNPVSGWQDVVVQDGRESLANFLNAGQTGTGAIAGNVWKDLNDNGTRDPEDSPIAGWTVFIDLNSDKVLDADEPFETTDGDGNYLFTGLLGGTDGETISYEVQQVLPAGWEPASAFDENYTAEVAEGETFVGPDFANIPVAISRIAGTVWNDRNGDGSQTGGEPGLGGWTVFADLNQNGSLDAGEPRSSTASNGTYLISGLDPGNVRIVAVGDTSYLPTQPTSGFQTVTAPNDGLRSNVNFGFRQRTDAAIGGVIYVDRNHDGARDPGEEGLPGITVYLDLNNDGSLGADEPSITTSTDHYYTPAVDEAGQYRFEKLAAGTYTVRQIIPVELEGTPVEELVQSVTLGAAEDRSDIDGADRYRPGEIHGFKFDDVDGNGIRDTGELGIEGVTIFIDLNRNNVLEPGEPTTLTAGDGSYAFTGLQTGAYVVREVVPAGWRQTFPNTRSGILWPEGTSNASIGDVTPTIIQASLGEDESTTLSVSLQLPNSGALTNLVDVFLLFDDTGSFTANSPIVRNAFPNIISQLTTRLPGIDLGFGVGRLEEYGGFASEFSAGRPFVLNQPIINSSAGGYSEAEVLSSIQAALDRVAPGYGGDAPETVIEALYQVVTGRGFDGNDNASVLDSGPAGLPSTQLTPGSSGDVPDFASFTPDPANGELAASGTIGGAGFRSGALPIIITATDVGFAYQPKGETDISGIDGLSVPVSSIAYHGRGSTPFGHGAGIQETVTGLNALGALVIGLGTNDQPSSDPRIGLESLASLTGAINRTTTTIENGTPDAIAPGDPFYFKIGTGGDPLVHNIADGIVAAIEGAVTSVNVNVALRASDPRVHISTTPGVIAGLGAGDVATFDVTFTGDGRPHRFDLQFVREGTDVVLGSIPVILGTPIDGDGYEFEDNHDGEHSEDVNFGNQRLDGAPPNVAPSFAAGADEVVLEDAGQQIVVAWASSITAGPAYESSQVVDFLVDTDNPALFAALPSISSTGTLTYETASDAFGEAWVTVRLHDDGGTDNGGQDTSAPQTLHIQVNAVNDAPVATADMYGVAQDKSLHVNAPGVLANDRDADGDSLTSSVSRAPLHGSLVVNSDGSFDYTPDASFFGMDDFEYLVSDGSTESTATVFISVTKAIPTIEHLLVADRRKTFEYDVDGSLLSAVQLNKEQEQTRGVTALPDGSVRWMVDAKGEVFIYNEAGQLIGNWEFSGVDKAEGVTVFGNDLWIVDRGQHAIAYFAGGALRRSGKASPTSTVALDNANRTPKDIATDGMHLWVVDDGRSADQVFVYTVGGSLQGTWIIDTANQRPTGISLDPNHTDDLWIVDAGADVAVQFVGATSRRSGSQAATATLPLNSLNSAPEGIAIIAPGRHFIASPVPTSNPVRREQRWGRTVRSDDSTAELGKARITPTTELRWSPAASAAVDSFHASASATSHRTARRSAMQRDGEHQSAFDAAIHDLFDEHLAIEDFN